MKSKWIIWTFIPWINWAGWIHAGIRSRYSKYFIFGGIYAIPLIVMMAVDKTSNEDFGIGLGSIFWIVGIIHSQMIKEEVNKRINFAAQSKVGSAVDEQFELITNSNENGGTIANTRMADIKVDGRMKVKTLKEAFKKQFGTGIRVYKGKKFADDNDTLAKIRTGDTKGGDFSLMGNMKVGNAESKFKESFGISIQIEDKEGNLADNGMTITAAGQ